jgi:hypothetical protein
MLAAALGHQAAEAGVAGGLAEAATQTALHYAAGLPVTSGVAALADGFLKALTWTRRTLLVGLVSVLIVVMVAVVSRPSFH